MKIKTSELKNNALNWAVALAEGHKPPLLRVLRGNVALPDPETPGMCDYLEYAQEYSQGIPIIERELISVKALAPKCFNAHYDYSISGSSLNNQSGESMLEAGLRCYVATKLGHEVDIPDKLIN